jgi:hypothetical protein
MGRTRRIRYEGILAATKRGVFLAFSAEARNVQKFDFRESWGLVIAGLMKDFTFFALDGYELIRSRSGIVQRSKEGMYMYP